MKPQVASTVIDGRTVTVLGPADGSVPVVYAPLVQDGAAALMDACHAVGCSPCALVGISGLDWDGDLTPWPTDATVNKRDAFTGHAPEFAQWLVHTLIPAIEGNKPLARIIAGYSLAGLFACYAPYGVDAFDAVVSASGSLWYPGFLQFAETSPFKRKPRAAYLSVGKKESHTRHPLVRTVGENTAALSAWYRSQGIASTFEENPGGHFNDPLGRLARGIAWTLEAIG